MAIVISFLNPKGGVGKTTCTQNIATCFYQQWQKVLLIDADPRQQTLLNWHQKSEKELPPIYLAGNESLKKVVSKASAQFDYIFIDGAAKLDEVLQSVVTVSDIILIPVQPSGVDIEGADPLLRMLENYQKNNSKTLKVLFLINAADKKTALSKEVYSVLEKLGLPILQNRLSRSVLYVETLTNGESIFSINTKRGRFLANEVKLLSNELRRIIHEPEI